MTSSDALILDLSTRLTPVRRRSVGREAGAVLFLGAAELVLVLIAGAMRPDLGRVILSPFILWKIGSLAVLAGASCTVAMRSFAPTTSARRGSVLLPGLAVLAIAGAVFVTSAAENNRTLIERLAPTHGMRCALAIVALALPMMLLLAVLMRRAAPVHPERSATTTGIAAATCGALIFSVCCPANDPLYVVSWYSVGVAAVTGVARWLLPRRFRL